MRLRWVLSATLLVASSCSGSTTSETITTDTTLVPITLPATSSTLPVATSTTGVATTGTINAVATSTSLPEGITLTYAQPGTPEAEVEVAVRLAEAAYLEAVAAPPNPNHPGISATRTEVQAETLRTNVQTLVDEGWAVRKAVDDRFSATIILIEMFGLDIAEVEICYLDDLVVYDTTTDEALNGNVVSKFIIHTYQRTDGHMKLAEVAIEQESEGVSGCVAVLP